MDNEKIGDESQAIILLNSLPESWKEVNAAIKFGRKSITLDEVISTLRSWEMEILAKSKNKRNGESLNIRCRQKENHQTKGRAKTRSKSGSCGDKWWKHVKCYGCQEVGHTKKFCPKKNKRNKEQEEDRGDVVVAHDGHDSADVLVVSTTKSNKKWIMDFGCSFHMNPNKDWFESLNEVNEGQVILGNDKCCKVKGVGTLKVKMHDGVERVLHQVRYIPGLKRNLISLGTLNVNGFSYKASGGVITVT